MATGSHTAAESAEQYVATLAPEQVRSLAALPDDEDLAVMMIEAFPDEQRHLMLEQNLVETVVDRGLQMTERAWDAIAAARELCPDPLAGIDVETLIARTQETVDRLVQGSEQTLTEVKFHEPRPTATERLARHLGLEPRRSRVEEEDAPLPSRQIHA